MSWEQDPWSVPGGVYAPRRQVAGGRNRGGYRGRGSGGGLRWLWVLAVCLVGYAAWGLIFGDHGIIRLRKLAAREAVLKGEIAEARGRVDQLRAQAANIDETRQTRARLDYDMARGDEIIYKTGPGSAQLDDSGAVVGGSGRAADPGGGAGARYRGTDDRGAVGSGDPGHP